jgi:aryl-alcohol dehydrogenase-like predicted oxidoreductase
MELLPLGNTGIMVSRLCFGALTIGPLQRNMPVAQGAQIIRRALEKGINFIDTAEYYRTYEYIREALNGFNSDVVIATKSYAYTYDDMKKSIKMALEALKTRYVDIFLLHEQESYLTFKGHSEAYRCLLDAKKAGLIKACGISTHYIAMVDFAADRDDIDVIHPLLNINGLGIVDGTREQMEAAVEKAVQSGKGVYLMKPLGGGNLIREYERALKYALNVKGPASVAVGMSSEAEVEANVLFTEGKLVPERVRQQLSLQKRNLIIESWCVGCGSCVKKCVNKALLIEGGKARVNHDKCLLCGYCSGVCPEFCIKII